MINVIYVDATFVSIAITFFCQQNPLLNWKVVFLGLVNLSCSWFVNLLIEYMIDGFCTQFVRDVRLYWFHTSHFCWAHMSKVSFSDGGTKGKCCRSSGSTFRIRLLNIIYRAVKHKHKHLVFFDCFYLVHWQKTDVSTSAKNHCRRRDAGRVGSRKFSSFIFKTLLACSTGLQL